jgi:OHCU decarboxylase
LSYKSTRKLKGADLKQLDRERFVRMFGLVFEHSPWVAEGAWEAGPFESLKALHGAMVQVCRSAPADRQLALIRAHPDLAGKLAVGGLISPISRREQSGVGLDRCTPEEFARFHELNDAYKVKFTFPFVVAVRGLDRRKILEIFAERLENTEAEEFERALDEIAKIALFRLEQLVET